MECVLELLARPAPLARSVLGEGARASERTLRHSKYILGSLKMLKQPEGAPKMRLGAWGQGEAGGNTAKQKIWKKEGVK